MALTGHAISDLARRRIDIINAQVDEIAASVREIANSTQKTKYQEMIVIAKSKRERLRTVSSIARLKTILAELDIFLAGVELEEELTALKRKRPRGKGARSDGGDSTPSPGTKPTTANGANSSKFSTKPTSNPQRGAESARSKRFDENRPLRTSTPLKQYKIPLLNKSKARPEATAKRKPIYQTNKPGGHVAKVIRTTGKSPIFLDTPPVRDKPTTRNNEGYYTTQNLIDQLGFVPQELKVSGKENVQPESISSANFSLYKRPDYDKDFDQNLIVNPTFHIGNQQSIIANKKIDFGNQPRNSGPNIKSIYVRPTQLVNQVVKPGCDNKQDCAVNAPLATISNQQVIYQTSVVPLQNSNLGNHQSNVCNQVSNVNTNSDNCNPQSNICNQQPNIFNQKNTVSNQKIIIKRNDIIDNIYENATNGLFKEMMDNKEVEVKTEDESISSIKTLILNTGWDI